MKTFVHHAAYGNILCSYGKI